MQETLRLTPMLRIRHIPQLFLHNDEAMLKRFAKVLSDAGLPDWSYG